MTGLGLVWLIRGPTLVGTVAALVSPVAASAAAAAFVLAGGFVLASLTSTAPQAATCSRTAGRLLSRPFAVIVGVNVTLGVLFGSSGVAVTARSPSTTGSPASPGR